MDDTSDGSTPLDADDADGLIPDHIATRDELNSFEALNISQGARWLRERQRTRDAVLTSAFVCELHRRLFGSVWRWAGEFRRTGKSVGNVHWSDIPVQLRDALDSTRAQLEAGSLSTDEIAIRLHHRLVQVHPFPNGNGRTARFFVDELLRVEGGQAFTWGSLGTATAKVVRAEYIASLVAADKGEFDRLRAFVRS